jgi:hypothetical protein
MAESQNPGVRIASVRLPETAAIPVAFSDLIEGYIMTIGQAIKRSTIVLKPLNKNFGRVKFAPSRSEPGAVQRLFDLHLPTISVMSSCCSVGLKR